MQLPPSEHPLEAPETTPEIRVFRTSPKRRAFSVLAGLPMIGIMVWFALFPWIEGRTDETVFVVFAVVLGFGMAGLLTVGIADAFVGRIELRSERVRKVGVFQIREIPNHEILGFRILQTQSTRFLRLETRSTNRKPLDISLTLEPDIQKAIAESFEDLDKRDADLELAEVLEDPQFGCTPEQRSRNLDRYRRHAKILNRIGAAATLWLLIFPAYYSYAIWVCVGFPLIAVAVAAGSAGLVELDGSPKSVRPNIAAAIIGPSLALTIRAFLDWQILDWSPFWLPFAVASTLLLVPLAGIGLTSRIKRSALAEMLVVGLCFGYGSTIGLNGTLDKSPADRHHANVLSKKRSGSQHIEYSIEVEAWGPMTGPNEIRVRRKQFDALEPGDEALIVVRHGRFGIPSVHAGRSRTAGSTGDKGLGSDPPN